MSPTRPGLIALVPSISVKSGVVCTASRMWALVGLAVSWIPNLSFGISGSSEALARGAGDPPATSAMAARRIRA